MAEDLEFAESDDERFAANVRRLRERQGWSQAELAKRLREAGYDQFHATTISRIENGERGVRLSEARAISVILGTALSVMLEPSGDAKAIQDFVDTWQRFVRARQRLAAATLDFNDARSLLRDQLREISPVVDRGIEWFDPEAGSALHDKIETIGKVLEVSAESVVRDAQEEEYGEGAGE
ncbi:helix-turn-helix transcriptional regulator [Georgenia sp. H159]|uniref:helix-turn-helix domain-containing protein n=1 Tax=Georgenia sp. H159 TaxID=3076115 RepID=UPI002D777A92|nr:helix-turn-helix transcriptional regulator [Georgenia sp. H159]